MSDESMNGADQPREVEDPPVTEFLCPECKHRFKGKAARPCPRCGESGILGYNGESYVPM